MLCRTMKCFAQSQTLFIITAQVVLMCESYLVWCGEVDAYVGVYKQPVQGIL